MDKRLILSIQYVCNERAIVLPWDAIGKHLDVTPGAISQHMAKLRQRLVSWGFGVPPPLRRSSGFGYASSSQALEKASHGPNAEKSYEDYNEDDEDPEIKEEEYGDEESDIEMAEIHSVRKGGRKVITEDEEEDEDVESFSRVRPTRRANRKQALEQMENSGNDLFDLYSPPSETKIQGRARQRARAETVASAIKSQATHLTPREISTSEEPAAADSSVRVVEDGKGSLGDGIGNTDESKEHRHVEMEDMFSEFSRPIGIDGTGSSKLAGMLADSTYSPLRRLWGQKQWSAGESIASWDEGRPYNSSDNHEPKYRFSSDVRSEFLINPDNSEPALEQNRPSVTTPTDVASPPATPKSRMPLNQYNNSTTTRSLSSPLGPAAVDQSERSQRTVTARTVTQHQHTARTAPGFSAQPDNASPREVHYQTPTSYPHLGASASTSTEAIKQELGEGSRYGNRNDLNTQFYDSGERTQFDELDATSLAGATDPFAGLNLGYSSYLDPEDAMDDFDAFSDGFLGFD
ncbi:MAG: hypothetical protein M1813_008719 [Trichoglossum hirsutum]|nr:MAG: hypothetical protein M1813_008719 [Trichoglossum hirsutum]